MNELAAQAILTPSRLTRVIERWPAAARSNVATDGGPNPSLRQRSGTGR